MNITIEENEIKGAVKTSISDNSVDKVGKLDIKKTKTAEIITKIGTSIDKKQKTDKWAKTNVIVAIVVGIFVILGVIWGICS